MLAVSVFDVLDLKGERHAVGADVASRLGEEERELRIVLERDGSPIRDVELDPKAEVLDVPAPSEFEIAHADGQVILVSGNSPMQRVARRLS